MRTAYNVCHLCDIFIFLLNQNLLLYQLALKDGFLLFVCFLLETVGEGVVPWGVDVESIVLLTALQLVGLCRGYSP